MSELAALMGIDCDELHPRPASAGSKGFQVFDEVALFVGAEVRAVVVADIPIARDACIETE